MLLIEKIQLIYSNLNCIKSKTHSCSSGDNNHNIENGISNKKC